MKITTMEKLVKEIKDKSWRNSLEDLWRNSWSDFQRNTWTEIHTKRHLEDSLEELLLK